MAEYVPLFTPGSAVTYTAQSDVIGGRLVDIVGDRAVAHAAADSTKTVGVAGFDAAAGDPVTVYSGGVQRPTAAAAIDAGDRVYAAAGGKVSAEGTNPIGLALTAAAAGATVQTKFDR